MSAKALGFYLNRIEASYPNRMDNVNYYLGLYADAVRLGVPDDCEVLVNKIQPYFNKVKAYNIIQSYSVMHAENHRGKTVEVHEGICFNYQGDQVKGDLACRVLQSSPEVLKILESQNLTLEKIVTAEVRNAKLRGQYLTDRHITLANISGFKEFKSCMEVSGLSFDELGMHSNQYKILSNVLSAYNWLEGFMEKPTLPSMEVFEGLVKVVAGSTDDIQSNLEFFQQVVSYQPVSYNFNDYLNKVTEVKLAVARQCLSEAYRFDDHAPAAYKRMQDLLCEIHGQAGNYKGLLVDESEIKQLGLAMKALASNNLP